MLWSVNHKKRQGSNVWFLIPQFGGWFGLQHAEYAVDKVEVTVTYG